MLLEKIRTQFSKPQPLFIGEENAFCSAVMIPLVQIDNKWHIVFEVRALKMKKQPGDISFPGGKIDATDASPKHAALRETEEELGVPTDGIEVIAALPLWIPFASLVIYPFVGVMDYQQIVTRHNPDEVEEVFTIPVDWLMTYEPYVHAVSFEVKPSADFPFDKIMHGENYKWRTHKIEEWFYDYENHTIWGLTAQILKYFIEQIRLEKC